MSTIKVTPNRAKRTFTIRCYDKDGRRYAKYRTISYSRSVFRNMEYNTENDWKWYLRHSGEYYVVR